MKSAVKIWLVIAASLVFSGLILFIIAMYANGWDFKKLSTEKYSTNTYDISEEFNNIEINTDTADIIFALSNNGKCEVICYEQKNSAHTVSAYNGTLKIDSVDNRKWYENIGINFKTPKIKVLLSKSEYDSLSINESTGEIEIPKGFVFGSADLSLSTGDVDFSASAVGLVKIKATTGDIEIENTTADALDLSVSTGEISVSDTVCNSYIKSGVSTGETEMENVSCKTFDSNGTTGDIYLKRVVAQETLKVKRSTGDVRFADSDAAEIFVKTDTGNVSGSFATDKVFITETSTGRVNVPKTVSGGRCEITTSTGDIIFKG